MPFIVADCPRCGVKSRGFDVRDSNDISAVNKFNSYEEMTHTLKPYEWCRRYELFSVCRDCRDATIFIVSERYHGERDEPISCEPPMHTDGLLNGDFEIQGFVRFPDGEPCPPPKLIPKNIEKIFNEGAICLTKECWNAAGTMFRQCVDLATKDMLPEEGEGGLTKDKQGNLGYRISWLFDNKKLSERLKALANCIRNDGNDGAHDGTLTKDDVEELLDFTVMLLEDIYTTPTRIKKREEEQQAKRNAKHAKSAPDEPTPSDH